MGGTDRTITATYRPINPHTLTIKQLSGDVTYTQAEFSTIKVIAEDAPAGMVFNGWNHTGVGNLASWSSQTTTFTFGNGDATITPTYVNVWTVTVINGNIDYGHTSALLKEGSQYRLRSRGLQVYERFDGWTQNGPGTISNTAASSTYFTVGNGDVTLTANISQYPDKTLTIKFRDPDTNEETLVSTTTYRYGTRIELVVAPEAPDKTTFASWEGDYTVVDSPLASTTFIDSLTIDATIIATYYYPEAPQYYTLTVYDGYPNEGSYKAGSQISIRPNTPNQGWEFYKWYGDTGFLVNKDVTIAENAVIMPLHSITLYAKFKVIGELPLYRVSVTEGIASGTYTDSNGNVQNEEGVIIDVPAETEVTLTANLNTVGYVFDYWEGNFEEAGVTDIDVTKTPTTFTMPEADLNITMRRRELEKYTLFTKNATGAGELYPGTYPISGTLQDTDDYHYIFNHWICVDIDGNDCINAIENPTSEVTNITISDKDLWIEAVYTTYYHLTVISGQDTGSGYYAEGEKVNTISADTPSEERLVFDHWIDPVGVVKNIYDPTPEVTMKDSVATITAEFISLDAKGNSVVVTGNDLHTGIITRSQSYLINGIFAEGTIVLDGDGCVGIITEVDPDHSDDTDDYKVEKLFYGGNF